MKVLVAGANGQLGRALRVTVPAGLVVEFLGRDMLDITDAQAVDDCVKAAAPDWIINAAGYTAVDRAESEPAQAFAVNAQGARNLAEAAQGAGACMVHVSTDFIFDGARGTPYLPDDPVNPLSVYGASKLEGEQAVRNVLGEKALIVRTAWLYAAYGHNFVLTILRLLRERDRLNVVADQIGSPTWAHGLAQVIWDMMLKGFAGTHHWTDAGVASWYDFAVAIRDEAEAIGLLPHPASVYPIASVDYPTPAKRPSFSVLDKTATWDAIGYTAPHWRHALGKALREIGGHA